MLTGLITEEFKDLHEEAIDEVIRGFSVTCRLIYKGGKWTPCPNCNTNPQTGKSTNTYKSGGPISFTTGVCPFCKGVGKIVEENTDDIVLGVIWDQKQFMGTFVPVDGNYIQTVSRNTHFPKIKRASQIIADTSLMDYSQNIFERVGEPAFAGFRNAFIFVNWKRVG